MLLLSLLRERHAEKAKTTRETKIEGGEDFDSRSALILLPRIEGKKVGTTTMAKKSTRIPLARRR